MNKRLILALSVFACSLNAHIKWGHIKQLPKEEQIEFIRSHENITVPKGVLKQLDPDAQAIYNQRNASGAPATTAIGEENQPPAYEEAVSE